MLDSLLKNPYPHLITALCAVSFVILQLSYFSVPVIPSIPSNTGKT